MANKIIVALLMGVFLIAGCAVTPKTWTSTPSHQSVDGQDYAIKFEPIKREGNVFVAFRLTVQNTSKAPLIIDWNKSRYILNGKSAGRFVFKGIDPKQVGEGDIAPDTIAGGDTMVKEIGPFKFIAYAPYRDRNVSPSGGPGISFGPLPQGENGILLYMRLGGKQIRPKLTLMLQPEPVK
jgi:hypothetical protein